MLSIGQILALVNAGDTSPFYNDRSWRKLSKRVKKKFHNECYLCRQAHRMSPARIVHHVRELKRFPQYAYSEYVDGEIQLMPVCFDCHERIHKRGRYAERNADEDIILGYNNEEMW